MDVSIRKKKLVLAVKLSLCITLLALLNETKGEENSSSKEDVCIDDCDQEHDQLVINSSSLVAN